MHCNRFHDLNIKFVRKAENNSEYNRLRKIYKCSGLFFPHRGKIFTMKNFFNCFFLSFIKILKKWKKIYIKKSGRVKIFPFETIRRNFFLRLNNFRQRMNNLTISVFDFLLLIKYLNEMLIDFLNILICFQKKYVQVEMFLDEILIRKFYLFYLYTFIRSRVPVAFFSTKIENIEKNRITIQKKFSYNTDSSLLIRFNFIKIKFLTWSVFCLKIFFIKKTNKYTINCKKKKETNSIFEKIFLVLYKINLLRVMLEKISKFNLKFEDKKKNKWSSNLIYFLHNNTGRYNHCTIFYNLLQELPNFIKFVDFLFTVYGAKRIYLKKTKISCTSCFSKIHLFFKNKIIPKLHCGCNLICMFILVERLFDTDKELCVIWLIVKSFKTQKYTTLPFNFSCVQKKIDLKKNFTKIIFIAKKRVLIVRRNNSFLKKIILQKIKRHSQIEDRLYEIKNMEIDFFEILNQFTYEKKKSTPIVI